MITQLDPSLTKLLKSQIVISNLPDAIRETLQNSIDATATNIRMIIDFARLSFVIIDNGEGITPTDLDRVTERYYTSKLKSFDELKKVKTWGFRGEALNSLSSVSNLTIVSKTKHHNGVYSVKFNRGRRLDQSTLLGADDEYAKEITSKSGTVLIIKGFFLNVPVRLEHLSKIPEAKLLEDLRAVVLQCVVAHPSITVEMYKKTGLVRQMICKYSQKENQNYNESVIKALSSIYGINISQNNRCLELSYKDYNVKCIIGSIPVQSKIYQSIYWNNRLLKDPDLFKSINKLFQDADFGAESRELLITNMKKSEISPKKGRSSVKLATTVGNPFSKHPVFVFNVTGPVSISDLIQDSDKSVHFSKHWAIVKPLVMKLCNSFLKMNGYHVTLPLTAQADNKVEDDQESDTDNESQGQILQIRRLVPKINTNLIMNSKIRMGKIQEKEVNGMISTKSSSIGSPTRRTDNNKQMVESLVKRQRLISKEDLQCSSHKHEDHHHHFGVVQTQNDLTITLDVIKTCKVIKQVDTKFILIKHETNLYIIDQHACDERIRVEALMRETIEKASSPNSQLSLSLKENSFHLTLSNMDFELFETYKNQLQTWGVIFGVPHSSKFNDTSCKQIQITHLPELLHPKLDINYQFIQRSLTQYVNDLHTHRKLKYLYDTSGSSWYTAVQAMPTIIQDLINSKACRSAIMFGTVLSSDQCQMLIDQLRHCARPYWCAHGRPSIVPLCDLKGLGKEPVTEGLSSSL